jgi:hypothetical protein
MVRGGGVAEMQGGGLHSNVELSQANGQKSMNPGR